MYSHRKISNDDYNTLIINQKLTNRINRSKHEM